MSLSFGRINFKIELNTRWFTVPPPAPASRDDELTRIGRPGFFQFVQMHQDRQAGVLWDSEVPLATVPTNEPPKVTIVHGPSRKAGEEHLPAEFGTNWGFTDPRDGKSMRDLWLQIEELPPPYSEH